MLQTIEQTVLPERLQADGLGILACYAHEVPDEHALQIIGKSRQDHIMEFEGHEDVTGDPYRFRSLEDYRIWANGKERVFYMLVNDALRPDGLEVPDIGGVIWFGRRQNEQALGCDITFAIRLYEQNDSHGWAKYRQRRLGSPFMQATHQDLRNYYQGEKIWLDLVADNEPAHNLYLKNGYRDLIEFNDPTHDGQRRIVMANETVLSTQKLILGSGK
jgi:GNAT superfamily N-acetyltransferase